MADEKDLKKAQDVYAALCSAMDADGWRYTRHEDDLILTASARGDDLPIDIILKVDAERNLLSLFSVLPVTVPENTRMEVAVAITIANNGIVHGNFDYDLAKGRIVFRMSNSYLGCQLGKEAFLYMLYVACGTVDQYNDKFLMVAKGMMTLEQFLQGEQH